MFRHALAWLSLLCLSAVGCSENFSSTKKKVVAVDSFILQDFCDSLLGSDIEVIFPVPPGVVPEDWSPSAADIAKIQQADLILLNGGNVSEWAEKASLPTAKVVKTWEGYKDKLIEIKVGVPHRHGDGPEHQHDGVLGFTWFDGDLAKAQFEAVKDALIRIEPSLKERIEENYAEILTRLDNLYTGIEGALSTVKNLKYVGSHPNYHYLARRYGLNFEYVHWEPTVMPTAEQLEELKGMKPDVFIWEATPLPEADEAVKQLGIATFVITPISGPVENSYWEKEMGNNRETMKNIYKYFKKQRELAAAAKQNRPANRGGDEKQNEQNSGDSKTQEGSDAKGKDDGQAKSSENADDANKSKDGEKAQEGDKANDNDQANDGKDDGSSLPPSAGTR